MRLDWQHRSSDVELEDAEWSLFRQVTTVLTHTPSNLFRTKPRAPGLDSLLALQHFRPYSNKAPLCQHPRTRSYLLYPSQPALLDLLSSKATRVNNSIYPSFDKPSKTTQHNNRFLRIVHARFVERAIVGFKPHPPTTFTTFGSETISD